MKLLLFYPTHFCTGMKPTGISMLKAHLQEQGHEVRIFDVAKYVIKEQETNISVTTKINTFKPVKESERYLLEQEQIGKAGLMEIILDEIDEFQPDLLGASLLTNNLMLAGEYLSFIKKQTQLPVIAGGVHPSVAPERTINLDWVDMICLGYGENPVTELLNSKLTNRSIPGIWFKENGKVIKNPIPPAGVDFENYAFPNWDDYSDVQFYKPFHGKVMRYGDVEFGRGCPYSCTFCAAPYMRKTFKIKCPRKSNEKMIEELVFLKKKYKVEIFRFWDELFLLVNDEQLSEFAKLYNKHVDQPFIIETTAESVTAKRMDMLKDVGCVSVSIGIESGNTELRNKVLNKRTSDETYIEKFHIINERDVNTTGYNMLGLPGETEANIQETIELNRKCNTRTPCVGLFYPYPGAPIRNYCIEKGYLSPDFDDDVEESILYTRSVLKQDHIIDPGKLKHYLEYFSAYCKLPKEMYSDIVRASVNDEVGDNLRNKIQELVRK